MSLEVLKRPGLFRLLISIFLLALVSGCASVAFHLPKEFSDRKIVQDPQR